ncbi:MAG TPA: SMC family ATPase [Dehalococcoidia bacterium]|nr:SMC family ATPase [Dehalococcoidia bacterium]
MKPIRLELLGFTAFRDTTVVDFEDRRLFVITGATGAGKSSLLDAMIWALYGQVPRVGRSTKQLVTHGESSMSVRFDFEARGRRYRVSRKAPAATGTRLEVMAEDGKWSPLSDRSREVTAQVTHLLGLDYATFTKTVVLPQGAFDSFLRGDEKDRRAILTRLLGLDTYEAAGRAARTRAGGAKKLAESLHEQLARLTLAVPGAVEQIERERDALTASIEGVEGRRERIADLGRLARAADADAKALGTARVAADAATAALAAATTGEQGASETVTAAEAATVALAKQREELAYDAEQHGRLRDLAALLTHRDEAQRAVDAAQRELVTMEAREQSAAASASRHEHEAKSATESLAKATTTLVDAAGDVSKEQQRLATAAEKAVSDGEAATQQETTQQERVQALETLATRAEALATERLEAEAVLADLRKHVTDAETTLAEAVVAMTAAEQHATADREALDRARMVDAATTLKRDLQPGDACPICGEAVGELAHDDAPDLNAAELAAADSGRTLDAARATHGGRAGVAIAAASGVAHGEQALAAIVEHGTTLDAELKTAGASIEEVGGALEGARAEAAQALARALAAREAVEEARAAAEEVALLLARLPADLEPRGKGVRRKTEPTPLLDALALREAAESEARAAGEAALLTAEQLKGFSHSVEQARSAHDRAMTALATIDTRVAATDNTTDAGTTDADALRETLADLDRRAERAGQLAIGSQQAGTSLAEATARRDERRTQRERLATEAEALTAAVAAAEQAANRAATAFDASRTELAADGLFEAAAVPDVAAVEALFRATAEEGQQAAQALGGLNERLERARSEVEEAKRMKQEIGKQERAASVAVALAQEMQGDRFIAYVQEEALRVLAADASARLGQLTSGRYRLVLEGSEFAVVDHQNGDEQRSVKTLSGGETFLTSLALSLALSERLPELAGTGGAISLESLFLDEGFGSLDSQALDVAIEGLESLADPSAEGRMVGVISHVPQLAERLDDRIEVVAGEETSTILA